MKLKSFLDLSKSGNVTEFHLLNTRNTPNAKNTKYLVSYLNEFIGYKVFEL